MPETLNNPAKILELTASIATLNANLSNQKDSIAGLTGEVRAGNQQNGQILSQLAVLASKQEDNNRYQETCDRDRDDIRRDFDIKTADLHMRITSNSTAISRIGGRTAGISITIGVVISLITIWVEAHR